MTLATYRVPSPYEDEDTPVHVQLTPESARQLAKFRLEQFREASGLSQKAAGELATPSGPGGRRGVTQSAVANWESPEKSQLPPVEVLPNLLAAYGRSDMIEHLAALITTAQDVNRPGGPGRGRRGTVEPRHQRRRTPVKNFDLVMGMETFASRIEEYESAVIPGLLHTEAYALAAMESYSAVHFDLDLSTALQYRMGRQQILTRPDPVEFWAVIELSALTRQIGGPRVHRDQLLKVVQFAQLPNVTIQVITAAAHPALGGGSFKMVQLLDGHRVGYQETRAEAHYYSAIEEREEYDRTMNHLRHLALSPDQSVALIDTLIE